MPLDIELIAPVSGRDFELRAAEVIVRIYVTHLDVPGTLGTIARLLGAADINTYSAKLSEDADGPGATIVLHLDRDVPADIRAAITDAVGAETVERVDLP
jgi:D-3-phosphoglycerate dehydrogenase / 2-oxoglutarate reductase